MLDERIKWDLLRQRRKIASTESAGLYREKDYTMGIETEDAESQDMTSSGPASATAHDPLEGAQRPAAIDEAEILRDRWMRAEAEIVNVRSRAKREIEDAKRYAVQKFASDVVETAENIRRGLESIPPPTYAEPETITRLREGFAGIERSFIDLLKRNGINREDPTGTPFDAERDQAISEHASSSHAAGTVLHAATSAWTLHGRLLRPAMVVVAKTQSVAAQGAHPL
jgi:molecular chaperone GrpE